MLIHWLRLARKPWLPSFGALTRPEYPGQYAKPDKRAWFNGNAPKHGWAQALINWMSKTRSISQTSATATISKEPPTNTPR